MYPLPHCLASQFLTFYHSFTRLCQFLCDTWIPEYVAAFVSLGSMIAIIAILAVYDGQSLNAWTFPDNVTINAVISVLNTVSKTSMTFALASALGQWRWIFLRAKSRSLMTFMLIDGASQGPLGSLRLIWNTKGLCVLLGHDSLRMSN